MYQLKILFAILSIICGLTAFLPYVFDIFRLKTKPHIFTWIIWFLTQSTATYAIFHGGGGIGGLELLMGTVLQLVVILFSLKYGIKDVTKSDAAVLIIALAAIVIWWQLNQPILSVFMVSAIDASGYIPTFRKSYKNPWSETLKTFFLFALSDMFSILALKEYNFLTMTYLLTILVLNISIVAFCLSRRKFTDKLRKA